MKDVVEIIILGCGARGNCYSTWISASPERAKVVAIAEPRDFYRKAIGDRHGVPEHLRFRSWEEVTALPRFADAVIICTQDSMHEEPAVACAGLGYHILLEKPVAPTEDACRRIVAAVKKANVLFAVCHVLRYTAQTRKIKELIAAGTIGDVISIQRLESVGYWHQAHSFVRGNWRNEAESSFMLLAKCCHDVDWICHVMEGTCERVSSFGALTHFTPANRPAHSAARCVDCPEEVERTCPYSALKIYLRDRLDQGQNLWPVNILTSDTSREGVLRALQEGPYGRCVYACDNDAVDHQVVNFQFSGNRSASLTMTAFGECGRRTAIFGTRGNIVTEEERIFVLDFLTNRTQEIILDVPDDGSPLTGHGGGDGGVMDSFISAVAAHSADQILSGIETSLASHLVVFAAEKSRRGNRTVEVEYCGEK